MLSNKLLSVEIFNSLVGPILVVLVTSCLIFGARYLRDIMVKVNKIVNYLFTPAPGVDGIPSNPGKIDTIDAQIDLLRKGQATFHDTLAAQDDKLDALLHRTETSNGRTIGMLAEDTAHKVEE